VVTNRVRSSYFENANDIRIVSKSEDTHIQKLFSEKIAWPEN